MSTHEKEKKLTRRDFLRFSGAALGATALAGCAVPQAPVAPPAEPTAAPAAGEAPAVLEGASVNFMGPLWFVPELNEEFRNFALDWATQNNVKFNIETSSQQQGARITSAIETGSGPNIVRLSTPPATFANALVDLTELAGELGDQQGGWFPAASYTAEFDGKWLGIPIGSHTMMANYREDWFQEAGYDELPDTWEELLEAGKVLKAAGHPFGYALSGSAVFDGGGHSLAMLWSFGGKEFNPDGSVALDSPETREALEFAIEFYNEACDPGVTAYTEATNNQAFLGGQISYTLNVNTIYLPARDSNPELAAAMNHGVPPLGPAGRFTYQGIPSLVVLDYTTGRDRDAAIEFLRDYFTVSNFAQWIKEGEGYLVPVAPVYEDLPVWPTDPKLSVAREIGSLGRYAGFELASQSQVSSIMQDQVTIGKMFASACTTGDVEGALDQALREIEDIQRQVEG